MNGRNSKEIVQKGISKNMPKSSITLSDGNRKIIGAKIWNLPTGLTCRKGVLCSKICYAKKAEKMYPGVLPSRMRNYEESKKITFADDMIKLLSKSKFNVVRIHESGDYYSIAYIRKWYKIASALPKQKFYSYTKRHDIFTKELLAEKPKNLTIIYSVDGVLSDKQTVAFDNIGWDKFAIIREHKTNCPSTSKDGWAKACVKDCTKCFSGKTTVINFAKH